MPNAVRTTVSHTLHLAGTIPGFVACAAASDAQLLAVCWGTVFMSEMAAFQATVAGLALTCCFFDAFYLTDAISQLPQAHPDDVNRLSMFCFYGLFDLLFSREGINVCLQDIGHVGDPSLSGVPNDLLHFRAEQAGVGRMTQGHS